MIKRKLLYELREHLSKREITLIAGPRQAGKTTLMKILEGELKNKGKKTVFFNLDIEEDRRFFTSQRDFLNKVELEVGKEGFVFIDEIQRKEDAGIFLKGIYDMGLGYKFVVSGSGSMELKEKIRESLVGRKREFELTTVDFEEFVNYKTDYKYENRLGEFFRVERERAKALLKEYLNYGGYPRVVISETYEEKMLTIEDIFSSYIDRDIRDLIRGERADVFGELIRMLAIRVGQLLNLSELASFLGISLPTLKNYIWYAEKTFIVKKVTPFYRNKSKELTKTPVYYFIDIGLRNYSAGEFGRLDLREKFSFPFQNLVYNILNRKLKHTGATLHFWRTKDGAEVDFVIRLGERVIPVEAKFIEFEKPKVSRSLRSFISKYSPTVAFVVGIGGSEVREKINGTLVIFTDIFNFMFYDIGREFL